MRRELGLTGVHQNHPMLVTKTESVSGKIYLAAEMARFDTIGIDCVAAGLNALTAAGAKPLLFSDSISCARIKSDKIKELEEGVSVTCQQNGVSYSESEIKELPDIFSYDQYDMTGYMTGILTEYSKKVEEPKDGDVIIGIPSNGLHNAGYEVARKKLYLTKASMELYYETLGSTLGELLLAPTRLYHHSMQAVREANITLKGARAVDHGGLYAAVRDLVGDTNGAVIKQRLDMIAPIYQMLKQDGNINEEQMHKTFNMGIGMLLVIPEEEADSAAEILEAAGEQPVFLGLVEKGDGEIRFIR